MTEPLLPERLEELMAGYVLGNLSSEEAEELRQLLKEHPKLTKEVARLQEVLEVIPLALPDVAPPPHLRAAILEIFTADQIGIQNPEISEQSDSLDLLQKDKAPHPNPPLSKGRELFSLAKGGLRGVNSTFARGLLSRVKSDRTLFRWSRVLGSAAALLALAFGLDNYRIRQQMTTLEATVARQKDVIAMLQQPNTHLVSLKGMAQASAASGNIVVTPGEPKAVLIVQNLPILPKGQFYQLWSIVNNEKVPWETFKTSEQGTVFVKLSLPTNSEVTALIVTVEASPISKTPAGPMVMTGTL